MTDCVRDRPSLMPLRPEDVSVVMCVDCDTAWQLDEAPLPILR